MYGQRYGGRTTVRVVMITTAVYVCIIALPAHALSCADVQRGVALAGTTNPAVLEALAKQFGYTVTPQQRRQALRCLRQGPMWGKRR